MSDGLSTRLRTANLPFPSRTVSPFVPQSALNAGLERSEFVAMFQPSVCPGTGRIIAVEATMRWDHPRRGSLAPFEFLCEADQFGLLDQVAIQLIGQAAFAAATWRNSCNIGTANGLISAPMVISLSGANLRTPLAQSHIDSYNRFAQDQVGYLLIKNDSSVGSRASKKIELAEVDDSRSSLTTLFRRHTNLHEVDIVGVSNLLHWYIATEHNVRSIQGDFVCPPTPSESFIAALTSWDSKFKTLTAAAEFSSG